MATWQLPVEGEILADKYRVERVLGQGGMGLVVAATHVHLDQRVAIKFLLPEATEHPEIVERFAREARAAARMQGKNVVRVIDVGTLPDSRTFMVMEYLEGFDLEKVLETHGALPVGEATSYVMEALEALAEAHAKGIVHRDLKPGNLFLSNQPDGSTVLKVLDFGISKLKDDRVALTKTSTAMGTAFYMSPEQLTNAKDVDERADVWSMGIILYELVSNLRPFDGDSMPEIIAKILRNNRKPLAELGLGIPPEFDAVISRCLASDREGRFADVAELAEALLPFSTAHGATHVDRIARVRGRRSMPPHPSRLQAAAPASRPGTGTGTATDPGTAMSSAAGVATTQLAISTGSVQPARSRSYAWLAAPAVGILAVSGIGAWMWKGSAPQPPAALVREAGGTTLAVAPVPTVSAVPAVSAVVVPASASIAPAPSASSKSAGDVRKQPSSSQAGDTKTKSTGRNLPQSHPPAADESGGIKVDLK